MRKIDFRHPAERILQNLGITNASEIDLEAIAWTLGAKVKYCRLDGCEARITGYRDKAIIRINTQSSEVRQRYSLAHEIGHWIYDRNKILACRSDEIGRSISGTNQRERNADQFAAELLMPRYIVSGFLKGKGGLTFDIARDLASEFNTSLTASAIRLIDLRIAPGFLLCYSTDGRCWFKRCKDVPEHWFPREVLMPESEAFDVLNGNLIQVEASPSSAETWFDRKGADQFDVTEESLKVSATEVLTFLNIVDEEMLDEEEHER